MFGCFWEIIVYQCKTMAFDVARFQKSKEIFETCGRKVGPREVCKIEAPINQNGAQMGARNHQHFETYETRIQETMRKSVHK